MMKKAASKKSVHSGKSSTGKRSLKSYSRLSTIIENEADEATKYSLFILNVGHEKLSPILKELERSLKQRNRRIVVWIPLASLEPEYDVGISSDKSSDTLFKIQQSVQKLKDMIERYIRDGNLILQKQKQLAAFDLLEKWNAEKGKPAKGRPRTNPPTLIEDTDKLNSKLVKRGEDLFIKKFIEDSPVGDTELYVILIDVYDIEFIKELRRNKVNVVSIIKLYPRTDPPKASIEPQEILDDFWLKLDRIKSERIFKRVSFFELDVPVATPAICYYRRVLFENQFTYFLYDIQDMWRQHKTYLENVKDVNVTETEPFMKEMDAEFNKLLEDIDSDQMTVHLIFDALVERASGILKEKETAEAQANESKKIVRRSLKMIMSAITATSSDSTIGEEENECVDENESRVYQPLMADVTGKIIMERNDKYSHRAFDEKQSSELYVRQLRILKRFSTIGFTETAPNERSCNNYFLNKLQKYLEHTPTDGVFLEVYLNILQMLNLKNEIKPMFKEKTEEIPEKLWQQYSLPNIATEAKNLTLLTSISDYYIDYRNQGKVPMNLYRVTQDNFRSEEQLNMSKDNMQYAIELLSAAAVLQLLDKYSMDYDKKSQFFSTLTDANIFRFWNDTNKVKFAISKYMQPIPTRVCFRDFIQYVRPEILEWLTKEEKIYDEFVSKSLLRPSLLSALEDNEKILNAIGDDNFMMSHSIKLREHLKNLKKLQEEGTQADETSPPPPAKTTGKAKGKASKSSNLNLASSSKSHDAVAVKEEPPPLFIAYNFGDNRLQLQGVETSFASAGVNVKCCLEEWLYKKSELHLEIDNLGTRILCDYSFDRQTQDEKNIALKEFTIISRRGIRIFIERLEIIEVPPRLSASRLSGATMHTVPSQAQSQASTPKTKSRNPKTVVSKTVTELSKSQISSGETKIDSTDVLLLKPQIDFKTHIMLPNNLVVTKDHFEPTTHRLVQKWVETTRDNELQRIYYPNGYIVVYYTDNTIRILKYNGTIFEIDPDKTREWLDLEALRQLELDASTQAVPVPPSVARNTKASIFTMESLGDESSVREEGIGDAIESHLPYYEYEAKTIDFLRNEIDLTYFKMTMPNGHAFAVGNGSIVFEYPFALRCKESFDYLKGELYIRREDNVKFYYTNETYEVLFTDKTLITTQLSEDIVIDDITFETNEEEEEEIHTDMEDNADEEEDIDPQLDVDDMNYIVGKMVSFSSRDYFLNLKTTHKFQNENYATLESGQDMFKITLPGKLRANFSEKYFKFYFGPDFNLTVFEDRVDMSANTCLTHNMITRSSFRFSQKDGEENFFQLRDFAEEVFEVSWGGECSYKPDTGLCTKCYCPISCKDCYCSKYVTNERFIVVQKDLSGYEIFTIDYLENLKKESKWSNGKSRIMEFEDKVLVLEELKDIEHDMKQVLNLEKFSDTMLQKTISCTVAGILDNLPAVMGIRCFLELTGDTMDVIYGINHMKKYLKKTVEEFQLLSQNTPISIDLSYYSCFEQMANKAIEIYCDKEMEKVRLAERMIKTPKPSEWFGQFQKRFAYQKNRLRIYKNMIRYKIRPDYKTFYAAGGHIKHLDLNPYDFIPDTPCSIDGEIYDDEEGEDEQAEVGKCSNLMYVE